jgi:hypothetical protein
VGATWTTTSAAKHGLTTSNASTAETMMPATQARGRLLPIVDSQIFMQFLDGLIGDLTK